MPRSWYRLVQNLLNNYKVAKATKHDKKGVTSLGGPRGRESESGKVKRKPDLMLILMAAFGVGVLVTLMLPTAANDTVAAPASELQAGVVIWE